MKIQIQMKNERGSSLVARLSSLIGRRTMDDGR
jgi:hypothetical protein